MKSMKTAGMAVKKQLRICFHDVFTAFHGFFIHFDR